MAGRVAVESTDPVLSAISARIEAPRSHSDPRIGAATALQDELSPLVQAMGQLAGMRGLGVDVTGTEGDLRTRVERLVARLGALESALAELKSPAPENLLVDDVLAQLSAEVEVERAARVDPARRALAQRTTV